MEAERGFPLCARPVADRPVVSSFGGCRVCDPARGAQGAVGSACRRVEGRRLKPLSLSVVWRPCPERSLRRAGPDHRGGRCQRGDPAALDRRRHRGFSHLRATIESEAGDRLINTGAVARELRITLEQTPPDLRQALRRVDLIGDEAVVGQLETSLADWARGTGLELESHVLPRAGRLTSWRKISRPAGSRPARRPWNSAAPRRALGAAGRPLQRQAPRDRRHGGRRRGGAGAGRGRLATNPLLGAPLGVGRMKRR